MTGSRGVSGWLGAQQNKTAVTDEEPPSRPVRGCQRHGAKLRECGHSSESVCINQTRGGPNIVECDILQDIVASWSVGQSKKKLTRSFGTLSPKIQDVGKLGTETSRSLMYGLSSSDDFSSHSLC
jgi:hypothetical protein